MWSLGLFHRGQCQRLMAALNIRKFTRMAGQSSTVWWILDWELSIGCSGARLALERWRNVQVRWQNLIFAFRWNHRILLGLIAWFGSWDPYYCSLRLIDWLIDWVPCIKFRGKSSYFFYCTSLFFTSFWLLNISCFLDCCPMTSLAVLCCCCLSGLNSWTKENFFPSVFEHKTREPIVQLAI